MPLTYPNCSSTAQSCSLPCCNLMGDCPSSYSNCHYFYDPNDYSFNVQERNCRIMATNTKVYVTCKKNPSYAGVSTLNGWNQTSITTVTIGSILLAIALAMIVIMILWYRKESENEFVNQWAKNNRTNVARNQQNAIGQQINGFSPERTTYQTIPLDSSMVQGLSNPFDPRELDQSMNRFSRRT